MSAVSTRNASSAVLQREAARSSRRWQTYASRVAFSAAMMGFVLLGINVATQLAGVADLSKYGLGLYWAYATVQMLLAAVIAPLVGARALTEERDAGTLDLVVLTRLTAGQVLTGKLLSRLLMLVMLVVGSLPILALVVTMGGVSVVEVVGLTVHTVVAIAVLGTLGAFFALFTRSTVLAAFAAAWFAVPAFIVVPIGFALLVFDYNALAQTSPLFAPIATNWWALLPVVAYAPVVWLVVRIGAPLFALTMVRADIRRVYAARQWNTRSWLVALVVLLASGAIVVPVAGPVCWTFRIGALSSSGAALIEPWADTLIVGVAHGAAFAWVTLLLYVLTWGFLRLGIDLLLTLEDLLVAGRVRRTTRSSRNLFVWPNPVAWRECRPRAWGAGLPAAVLWVIALFAMFQTGLWLIPGGLVGIGAICSATGMVLSVWLAVRSVEKERRDGTLELLLASTQTSTRIVLGKLAGVALPTLPMIAVSMPMMLIGYPYLAALMDDLAWGEGALRGLAVCAWLVPAWLVLILGGLVVGLRSANHRAAYGIAIGGAVTLLGIPALGSWLFSELPLLALPFRLLSPIASLDTTWWQALVSVAGAFVLATALFVWLTLRLRTWGSAHA